MSFDCSYGGALLLKCCFFPTHFVFCFLDILRVFLEQGMLFLMMLPSLLYLILKLTSFSGQRQCYLAVNCFSG